MAALQQCDERRVLLRARPLDLLPRTVGLNLSSRLVFRVQDANAAHLAGCPGAEQIPRSRPGRREGGSRRSLARVMCKT